MEESGKSIDRIGGLRLQSLLRGLRSRKPSVREFTLQEASRLDTTQKSQLDAMVARSFKEEAGRRRFWRFMAFYGSPLAVGVVVSLLRRLVPGFPDGLADLCMLVGWLVLWRVMDRAAKRAFVLPEDGRKLWQQRREAESREAAIPGLPPVILQPSPAIQAFAQELADVLTPVREGAQQKAALFSEQDLMAAARLLMEQYEQGLDRESRKRSRLSNLAFWLFVAGTFTHIWPFLFATLGLGLYALYYRDEETHRQLNALPVVLEELARRGVPVSLDGLTPNLDPTLADRMRRQCPALDRFLSEKAPSEDLAELRDSLFSGVLYSPDRGLIVRAAVLSAEERDALREGAAEVLLAPFDDVEETLIALKRLEEIGDEAVIPMLQRLAVQPLRFLSVRAPLRTVREYRQDTQRIREAARSCLDILQARSDVQQRTLLRPSEATTSHALLRPVETSSNDLHPEELLRPSEVEMQSKEAVVPGEPRVYASTEEPEEVKAQVNYG